MLTLNEGDCLRVMVLYPRDTVWVRRVLADARQSSIPRLNLPEHGTAKPKLLMSRHVKAIELHAPDLNLKATWGF